VLFLGPAVWLFTLAASFFARAATRWSRRGRALLGVVTLAVRPLVIFGVGSRPRPWDRRAAWPGSSYNLAMPPFCCVQSGARLPPSSQTFGHCSAVAMHLKISSRVSVPIAASTLLTKTPDVHLLTCPWSRRSVPRRSPAYGVGGRLEYLLISPWFSASSLPAALVPLVSCPAMGLVTSDRVRSLNPRAGWKGDAPGRSEFGLSGGTSRPFPGRGWDCSPLDPTVAGFRGSYLVAVGPALRILGLGLAL